MTSSSRSVLRNLVSQWHIWLHCYTVGHNATHLRGHILTLLATLRRMATLKHILPHYDISGHTATYGHTVTHLAMLRICGHITSHLYGPVMTHLAILQPFCRVTLQNSWPLCDTAGHVITNLVTLRHSWPRCNQSGHTATAGHVITNLVTLRHSWPSCNQSGHTATQLATL